MQLDSKHPAPEILNAWLDGDQIVALYRAADGGTETRAVRAEWVSYHRVADVDMDRMRAIRNHAAVRAVATEGEWLRISWRDRYVREKACKPTNDEGIANPFFGAAPAFEGDVHPVRRWMTDIGARVARPRRGYFDLETDSRVPFAKAREGGARILSWALVDDAGNEWSELLTADTDAAEKALIESFFRAAQSFELLCAWNGDRFDFPVLHGRVREVRARVDVRRWLWLDHLACYKRNHRESDSGDDKTSLKLQDVAMALINEGKDDFDASKTWQEWEAGGVRRERLRKYNAQDTHLLRKIEAKTGYIELSWTLAQAAGVFLDSRGLHPISQVDAFMFRLGRERGVHFPTKEFQEINEQFAGAYVLKPTMDGVIRDVHVADFRRQYPSAIITWNMSPETKLRTLRANHSSPELACEAPTTKVAFRTDIEGMLPLALKQLIALRDDWDAKKSSLPPGTPDWENAARHAAAYKAAINSFYGVIGSPFSRYFDKEIAESVTQTCAWLIKHTKHAAEERGWKVIYIDTDSIFVVGCTVDEFREFTKWCNAELYPRLVAEQGCRENDVYVAYEKAFDRVVFVAGKKYVGRYLHYKGKAAQRDSKPEIKGLEYKRGDSSRLARALQETVVKLLVGDWEEPFALATDDPAAYVAAVEAMRAHVLGDELPACDVIITKNLSRELGQYKARKKADGGECAQPRHVVVGRELARRGVEVGEGTRVGFVVLDASTTPAVVIPADDYAGECDRHYLWENLVYPPAERLLAAAFPGCDWKRFSKSRPPKPRKVRASVAGKGASAASEVPDAPSAQVSLFDAPASSSRARETKRRFLVAPETPVIAGQIRSAEVPFYVDLAMEMFAVTDPALVRAILAAHPGARAMVLRLHHENGAVVELDLKARVDGSPELAAELARHLATGATSAPDRSSDGPSAPNDVARDYYARDGAIPDAR
jgi:DNA polymerase elongation subunit (family B)